VYFCGNQNSTEVPRFLKIALLAALMTIGSTLARAQYVPQFDINVQQLSLNAFPNYHFEKDYQTFDYYTQYAPAVLMLGLKACGYQSRSTWGRMLVSDAFSASLMFGVSQGLKYAVGRTRPDGGHRSFPSGHSATAFMTAAMLNHEYGWRSPWIGFTGYTLATATTVGRIMNNRHWMTDTFAGAVIGVGSVELGYFLADLIFKDKQLTPGYEKPEFDYCSVDNGYYSLQFGYSYRFVIGGGKENKANSIMPLNGSNANITAEIPVMEGAGVAVRAQAGSLVFKDESSFNVYSGQVGLFWEREYFKYFELEAQTLMGYAGQKRGGGIDVSAAISLNIIPKNNFKLRAIAEWETMSFASKKNSVGKPYLNSILLGYSAAFYW